MTRHAVLKTAGIFAVFGFLWLSGSAHAAVELDILRAGIEPETKFIINTLALMFWGVLIMWISAGAAMMESGMVRSKNSSVICLKNIGLYSITGVTYYLIGYNLMYTDVGSLIGSFTLFHGSPAEEIALLKGAEGAAETVVLASDHSAMSDWFIQMVYAVTTASIVSGALAERVKMWSFFAFIAILTGIIYPIIGAWTWGGGWLHDLGFKDLGGSTIIHATGGWAALAGILIVGPRLGKFRSDGSVKVIPPSNTSSVTVGLFIIWMGWLGFNASSQLNTASAFDIVATSNIFINTNLAAAAGVITALGFSRLIFGRIDMLIIVNGAIAGLVSITAGPDVVEHYWAVVIGAVGGLVCTLGMKLMEIIKLDDVVGAIPAHLFADIWGTLAVCIFADGNLAVQAVGIVSVGAFVFTTSLLLWLGLKYLMGVRVSNITERLGQDVFELGIEAYPEFVVVPEKYDD